MSADKAFRTSIGLICIGGTVLSVAATNFIFWKNGNTTDGSPVLCMIVFLMMTEFIMRVLRWIQYEPLPPANNTNLPTISVVIPAYNESTFVRASIQSVIRSDYPVDKLELIVVDDGSSDDTWRHINEAVKDAKRPHQIHKHPQNLGKRHAMRNGFMMARNEIIVSLDSDSIIGPQALRCIVAPFVNGPGVGGVTGRLTALNVSRSGHHSLRNVIPRMLDILFEHGGNIPRAAQSYHGFVTIMPGAFSAFRAEAILPHVNGLCNMRFLGEPLKHGEDVELTLRMLQDGWQTTYQSNAVVHTTVPDTPRRAMLMYTRWEKSSYTFFALGYVHLVLIEALRPLLSRAASLVKAKVGDVEKHAATAGAADAANTFNRTCGIYPAIQTICAIISYPFVLFCFITSAVHIVSNPASLLLTLGMYLLVYSWRTLLLIADARVDRMSRCDTDADGELTTRAERLHWRLQYSCLSVIFETFFLSWSSVFGIFTIRSQSWLTR